MKCANCGRESSGEIKCEHCGSGHPWAIDTTPKKSGVLDLPEESVKEHRRVLEEHSPRKKH